jgi:NAD(P)-dependent dehydrogenase (short-subunit alcohol dehydrogenase family)
MAEFWASKGGMRLFTKAIALEYARERVRVKSVHLGIIDTPIWSKLSVGDHKLPFDLSEMARRGVPSDEPGRAQDVADGVVFFASDLSRRKRARRLRLMAG